VKLLLILFLIWLLTSCSLSFTEPLNQFLKDVMTAENESIFNQSLFLSTLSITVEAKMPPHSAYEMSGCCIVLCFNYFQVMLNLNLQIFRYHMKVASVVNAAWKQWWAFKLLLNTASFSNRVRSAVTTDYWSMLITVQRLDLSTENQRISCIVYYEAEETGLKSEQPSTYTFKISYTNTLFVQELLNYISFTERFTDYSDKDSVL